MRKLSDFVDENQAARLAVYLETQNIECEVRLEDDEMPVSKENQASIWIMEDRFLKKASGFLADFEQNPDGDQYAELSVPSEKKKTKESGRKKTINVRTQIFHKPDLARDNVTLGLIFISTMVYMAIDNNAFPQYHSLLLFSEFPIQPFYNLVNGVELWRLVTPIFIHGGFFHILFNMLWLFQLGGQVERVAGSRYLAVLVIFIAIVSNTFQAIFVRAIFGGMSGVVYGLLGFLWMMTRYDPSGRYYIDKATVGFMVVLLFLFSFGWFGSGIANWCHGVGFVSGIAWGYVASGEFKHLRDRKF